ncbi:MAG: hypothetical protein HQ518_16510 [Rhodopirellula sp.]|nr:hypothetical protein [Rhodopirellula sp.]
MQLIYQCPKCDAPNIEVVSSETRQLACSSQDWTREITSADIEDDRPKRCLCCGNEDLWRQKDFPQGLGLLMVVTGGTLSTIAWAYVEPIWALGILLVFAAIDMILYAVMNDVLVCYRCRARHRKANIHDDHPRFNLELNERYRQEEIRLADHQKSS